MPKSYPSALPSRRGFLCGIGVTTLTAGIRPAKAAETTTTPAAGGTNIIEFEKKLKRMRFNQYQHPPIDILATGFRPVGGCPADFCTVRHEGRDHFFYIERRLQEATPFYPGHEIYFGHASTANFFDWEVHDPVLLVRPGTWEEAHVWAPFILKNGDEYLMVYTGLNRHFSQDLGIASSKDLFDWKRWDSNPISPCKGTEWAAWWTSDIASCRDPHLLRHDGRVWMVYTANTKQGASCLAMTSTTDFKQWRDHGPILVGPSTGYEPKMVGPHTQASLESSNLSYRAGRWILHFNATLRDRGRGSWIVQSSRMDSFNLDEIKPFWDKGVCIEVVRDKGDTSLLIAQAGNCLKFGTVDWSQPQPAARFVTSRDELAEWASA